MLKTIIKDWILQYGKKISSGKIHIPVSQQEEAVESLFVAIKDSGVDIGHAVSAIPNIADVLVPSSINEIKNFKTNKNLSRDELVLKLKRWCFFCAKMLCDQSVKVLNVDIDFDNLFKALLKKRGIKDDIFYNNINKNEAEEFASYVEVSNKNNDIIYKYSDGCDTTCFRHNRLANVSSEYTYIQKIMHNLNIDPDKILFIDINNLPSDYPIFEDLDSESLAMFGLDNISKEKL